MKGEYHCPYCQYMSLRKWNVQKHVRNVHGIKDFSNKSNEKPNINHQNIRPTEYVQFNFPNGSNEKPQIYQQKKFHTESECENQSENKVLIRPTEYVQFNFPNGSNEKPQIYQQKKFHTKSECENQSENKVLRCLCEPSQPCHAEIQQQFAIQMGKNDKYEICIDITVDKRLCNKNKQ